MDTPLNELEKLIESTYLSLIRPSRYLDDLRNAINKHPKTSVLTDEEKAKLYSRLLDDIFDDL